MSDAITSPRSFQEIILRLQSYWATKGCAILQPYDMEVGAGTFHPATTLRSLGTKPWAAAYVQPSRRPTDGRGQAPTDETLEPAPSFAGQIEGEVGGPRGGEEGEGGDAAP